MAYFANGTEGMRFDEQCSRCKYGGAPCPIALVQMAYNYDAVKNKIASSILGYLVKDTGKCMMWEMAKADFEIDSEQNRLF